MKRIILFLSIGLLALACNDAWDKHYNAEVQDENISPLTLFEYFQGEAEYSEFFSMLKSVNVDTELSKDQYLTVWAVKNSNFNAAEIGALEPDLVARYHLNYLALGASDLKHGMRVRSLNGVYITIKKENGLSFANTSRIVSSKRFKNGVVHEIETIMMPRINMFDYLMMLPDDYSIIRDSIVSYNQEIFDKTNSIPIGVDPTGNTIYDSVFYLYNPMFTKADFGSEFLQFTMFLPSNKVVEGTLEKLKKQYEMMGKTFGYADTLLAINWIKEAMFHKVLVPNYQEKKELKSAYDRVWRTDIQKVDESRAMELSNGIVYEVTDLKIPNNVIITRIKSLVHYYEYLTPEEQAELYTISGATEFSMFKGDVSPVAGFYYWLFQATGDLESQEEFSVEFTPLGFDSVTGKAYVMKVPPGEYNFYMGFQSKGHPFVDIFFKAGSGPIGPDDVPVAVEVPAANSSPWNYDRVNETDPKISRWNGLGGLVGVVNIPGDEMGTFKVKVKFNKLQAVGQPKRLRIYHWSLKPTANNY